MKLSQLNWHVIAVALFCCALWGAMLWMFSKVVRLIVVAASIAIWWFILKTIWRRKC